MIKKDELKPGMWYEGFSRGSAVALWDGDKESFLSICYELGAYYLEVLLHEEDRGKKKAIDYFEPKREIRKNSPTLEEFRIADAPWLERAKEHQKKQQGL